MMTAPEHAISRLPLVVDGKAVVLPCVEIMGLSVKSKAGGADGYISFHDAFMRRFGARLTYYRLSDSTKWKRFEAKDRLKVPSWFSDSRSLSQPMLGIAMHTGPVAGEPQMPLLEMFFDHVSPEHPQGMCRIALPVDQGFADTKEILDLVDDAMSTFPLHWGTAGYGFYWKDTDSNIGAHAEQWLGRHLIRHPGLATGDYLTWGTFAEYGVANIGWITFVGDDLIAKLGGRNALASMVAASGLTLRTYGKGVGLQVGPRPELGDVNRRQTLPLHHEVGRILQPVFAPDDKLELISVTGLADPDQRLEWLRRFLP